MFHSSPSVPWIGMQKEDRDCAGAPNTCVWKWIDGNIVHWDSKWLPAQQDRLRRSCGALDSSQTWMISSCWDLRYFICEAAVGGEPKDASLHAFDSIGKDRLQAQIYDLHIKLTSIAFWALSIV